MLGPHKYHTIIMSWLWYTCTHNNHYFFLQQLLVYKSWSMIIFLLIFTNFLDTSNTTTYTTEWDLAADLYIHSSIHCEISRSPGCRLPTISQNSNPLPDQDHPSMEMHEGMQQQNANRNVSRNKSLLPKMIFYFCHNIRYMEESSA